ncbi:MAG: hypothetical protein V5A14_03680 [Desulfohalobiaceae bacterium]
MVRQQAQGAGSIRFMSLRGMARKSGTFIEPWEKIPISFILEYSLLRGKNQVPGKFELKGVKGLEIPESKGFSAPKPSAQMSKTRETQEGYSREKRGGARGQKGSQAGTSLVLSRTRAGLVGKKLSKEVF